MRIHKLHLHHVIELVPRQVVVPRSDQALQLLRPLLRRLHPFQGRLRPFSTVFQVIFFPMAGVPSPIEWFRAPKTPVHPNGSHNIPAVRGKQPATTATRAGAHAPNGPPSTTQYKASKHRCSTTANKIDKTKAKL